MTNSYQFLINKLDEFIRKYYKNLLLKGLIYSISLVLLFYVSIIVLEYFARFDTLVRTILFYSFLLVAGFIIARWIIVPLLKLNKLGKTISHSQAAQIIGVHFKNVEDKLLNVLQLQEQKQHLQVNISGSLIEASIDQKINELKPVPFTSAIDLKDNKKYLKYAFPPVVVFLVILFSAPSIITDSTKRLVQHQTYFEAPSPFRFEIQNKNLKTMQSDDFSLEVKVTGEELPESAYIEIDGARFKLNKANKLLFNHIFKNVQTNIRFRFFADGFYSNYHELLTLPSPIVLDFDVSLEYPSYTGKKNEHIKNTGDLVIPAGTKVSWNFNTRNARTLRLNINDSLYTLAQQTKDLYFFTLKFLKSTAYSIKTTNEYHTSKDSMNYSINVIPDLFPSIEMDERIDSLSSQRIYFRGLIKDDYGFKKLSFNYTHNNPDSSKTFSRDIFIDKAKTQGQFFHYWDIAELGVIAGDEIEYYFEVWDNDGVNGSKSSRTAKMIFKAPTLKEIAANTEKNNSEIKKSLEKSIKEAKEIQKELGDLNKKLLEKKTLSWEEKKKLEKLLNKQKKLQKNIEQVQKENQQNNKQQSEYKQIDERLLEKQQQLEKMFNEIMSDEMKEMMEQLEKLMEELNKDKLQETLDQMKLDNKDLEKELDRSLELFKQLEFEQKMQEAIEKLNDLAEQQEKLSEKNEDKKEDEEKLKEQQDGLNKAFDELKKDIENIEKKNQELENPNKMDDTKQEQNNIENDMKNSSEQLENNKRKKASESQKNAADKMKQLSQKMDQMMAENQNESAEEDIDALREIMENLIHLSLDQENLMTQLKTTDKSNPQYLKITQHQKKLKDDSKLIEDSLFALSKRVPQLDAIINKEINTINQNIAKALNNLEERQTPQAANRQQYVMTSTNNLALLLGDVLKQMQQQLSQQKQGQQSCKKPGSSGTPQPKPSASSMRKMQEKINKEMQKLKQQMEKEGNQPKSGKGGNKGMSKDLAKLAAQQEAIRQQLQELTKELNKKGNGGSKGLDKLANKMEESEKELVNKKISQETLKRQQEILTRLLEAENAEREREMDEKRQSNESKNQNYSNPSDFFEYKRLKQKEEELLKTVPVTLFPFYKNKVSEYFNTIED